MQVRPIQLAEERPHIAQTPASFTRLAHLDAPALIEPKPLQNPRSRRRYQRWKNEGIGEETAQSQVGRIRNELGGILHKCGS
jgi:hypothetical protein